MNWCRFFGESIYLGSTNYNILTLLCSSKVSSFLLPQTKTRSRLGQLMLPGIAPWGLRCHSLKTYCSVLENLFGALDTSSRSGPWEGFQELSLSLDGAASQKLQTKVLGFCETQISISVLPSIILPWLSLTRGRETSSLTMHPQQSWGSAHCEFRGSFRNLAEPSCLETEFLDMRRELVGRKYNRQWPGFEFH